MFARPLTYPLVFITKQIITAKRQIGIPCYLAQSSLLSLVDLKVKCLWLKYSSSPFMWDNTVWLCCNKECLQEPSRVFSGGQSLSSSCQKWCISKRHLSKMWPAIGTYSSPGDIEHHLQPYNHLYSNQMLHKEDSVQCGIRNKWTNYFWAIKLLVPCKCP